MVKTETRRLGPLYLTLPLANVAVMFLWMSVGAFVLPVHVQRITGVNDVAALGLANSIGPLMATIANPVFGQISDRTRSRFGRRSPWILGCVAIGVLALLAQANAASVLMLGISWAGVQTIMNGYQAAVTAILPDRVPPRRYGTFSALVGLGTPVATIAGALMFMSFPQLAAGGAYYVVMVVLAVAAVLIVFASPDTSSAGLAREPFRLGEFMAAFVKPLRNANFTWAFVSRFGVMLGYFIIFTFNLFLLEEFIKIPKAEVVPKMAVLMLIGQVATLAAVLVIGPISDRIGRFRLFALIAGLSSAVTLAVPLFLPTFEGMIVYNVTHGIAFGIYLAVDMALVTKVLPDAADAGKDMGVINIANAGPQILAPAVAAFVVTQGGYASLFVVGIVVSLIGAVGVLKIKGVR
ncbi:MFS transporter [Nonomuraea sp. NN258]|uniref:MFS transporter n=1 Tax=Nonomuraea antri TaxID=2730852 RepID=UPI00156A36ED|nr:MFS transporter [Nonomuraea antri]NRQ34948.1 MFS transporter [Nonomuraea antri]